jgi:hypothetical protein
MMQLTEVHQHKILYDNINFHDLQVMLTTVLCILKLNKQYKEVKVKSLVHHLPRLLFFEENNSPLKCI